MKHRTPMKMTLHMAGLAVALAAAALAASAADPAPSATPAPPDKEAAARSQLLAPDGVPYDNQESFDVMQRKPLSANLVANGSFETGRYWPEGWQPTDGLTSFWVEGGTDGARCLKICTDVLEAQWQARDQQVRAALEDAMTKTDGRPQSLPASPIPPAPERIPTQPPYYDTVAGVHGVHYRTDFIPCVPGAIYRFSIDARTDGHSTPRVFIKGFFDQEMKTEDGVRSVRRDAYRAPMILDPCDGQWRRYARLFHPARSQSTLGGKPVQSQWLQVQVYAYWRPDYYYFDNVRLDIVGMEEPAPAPAGKEAQPAPAAGDQGPPLGEDDYPVFKP